MKINKKGEVKLASVDTKIGEFVVTRFKERLQIQTTSKNWMLSFENNMLIARLIDMFINDGRQDKLHTIIVCLYNSTCIIPDVEYLSNLTNEVIACMDRNKQLYGQEDISDKEDAKIIDELRKDQQAADLLKENMEK